jgi:hypothetical protein
MSSRLQKAIIKTLCYADVFDFPLTVDEIWKHLISNRSYSRKSVNISLEKLKIIDRFKGYYYMKGRNKLYDLRLERKNNIAKKIITAEKIADFLKIIPSVKMIGITGTLAVENAGKNDDIDLFIVTGRRLLWTTRFFVTLFVEIVGLRRHPGQKNIKDTICLNMFLDEDHLGIPIEERNIYTAHEVVQLKSIYSRNCIFEKFLSENRWVRKFLPNSMQKVMMQSNYKAIKQSNNRVFTLRLLDVVEILLRKFQLWYMRKKITNEIVSNVIIRFHPNDTKVRIIRKYLSRIRKYYERDNG